MRDWKNWLFPILTCLTVLGLALLPLRLSLMRDGELTGAVHAEPLSEDSNFPFKPPDLPGRVWLLVQYQTFPENVVLMEQRLEEDSEDWRNAVQMADGELDALYGEGIAPFGIVEPKEAFVDYSVTRLYLRNPEDLTSASFLLVQMEVRKTGSYINLVLDGETGKALCLEQHSDTDYPFAAQPEDLGRAFLDRLGLTYTLEESDENVAHFRLRESGSEFWAVKEGGWWLSLEFQLDWSAVDAETAELYGYPGMSTTDAGMMQKR